MTERPNNRVSMGLNQSGPTCGTCPFLKGDANRWGGWCQHPSNRVVDESWPLGFTPSQSSTGGCDLHPALGVTRLDGETFCSKASAGEKE